MAPKTDNGGGTFAGIDPGQMKQMIKDLEAGKAAIEAKIPGLKGAFEKAGLSTKPIAALTGVASWIGGELPMLNRRQAMAEQLAKENSQFGFGSGMVQTEWEGHFKSKAEAEAKARELAAKAENGQFPPEVWAEIIKYQGDPDFAAAFIKALGPQMAAWVTGNLRADADLGKDDEQRAAAERLKAFASLMATASHRGVIDEEFLKKFSADGVGTDAYSLASLIQHGTWDKAALLLIGAKALEHGQLGGGNYLTADMLKGLSRNPLAANEFYTANFDMINAMALGRLPGWTNTDDARLGDPLGEFIKAATVDASEIHARLKPPGATEWANPGDDLTRRIALEFARLKQEAEKKNPDQPKITTSPFEGVQLAYGHIIAAHYDDIRDSVTSPLPDYFKNPDHGRPGVELPADAWAALAQQALVSPKAAAELNIVFSAGYVAESTALARGELPDAKDANSLDNRQNGQVAAWFLTQANEAKTKLVEDVKAYNATVDSWTKNVLGIGAGMAVGAATAGPGGAAAGAGIAGRDAVIGLVSGLGVDKASQALGKFFHKDKPEYGFDTDWASATAAWRNKAKDLYEAGNVRPVTDKSGITWTGDPTRYESPGAEFTEKDSSGKVIGFKDVADMSPAAQRAYMKWLEDPAIQNATWNEWYPDHGAKGDDPGAALRPED